MPQQNDKYVLKEYPECIVLDTTYRCNLKCKMCHQSSDSYKIPKNPDVRFELVERLIPLLKNAKTVYLLGYGEPLMHPRIYDLVSLIKKECPDTQVAFTSNGTLLTENNINKLIGAKLDVISISMDGPNLERGHQNSEQTAMNVRAMAAIKKQRGVTYPSITIGMVLGKDNENELLPLINFAIEVGATGVTVEPLRIVAPNPKWDDYIRANNIYDHLKTIAPILRVANELARAHGINIQTPYIVGV